MSYIKDAEIVYSKMHTNQLPFYRVIDSDGKSLLDENDDENTGVDEAVNRLRDSLDNIVGLVTVVLSEKNKKQKATGGSVKGDFKYTLKLGDGSSKSPLNGFSEAQNDSFKSQLREQYEERIKLLTEKHESEKKQLRKEFETEKRIEKLELSLKEAKDGGIAEQYLPIIAGLLTGQQPNALSGISEEKKTPDPGSNKEIHLNGIPESNKQRLTNVLNRLFKRDGKLIEHLEMLAALAEQKPFKYKLAIETLKGEI